MKDWVGMTSEAFVLTEVAWQLVNSCLKHLGCCSDHCPHHNTVVGARHVWQWVDSYKLMDVLFKRIIICKIERGFICTLWMKTYILFTIMNRTTPGPDGIHTGMESTFLLPFTFTSCGFVPFTIKDSMYCVLSSSSDTRKSHGDLHYSSTQNALYWGFA